MKFDAKLAVLLIAVVVVATTGSAFLTSWVVTNRGADGSDAPGGLVSARSEPFDPELVWNAGEFTVNLATNSSLTRYLKTSMSFRASSKAAVDELEKRRVQVQDRVIMTLRMTQVAELQQPDGVNLLKERLLEGVNELLTSRGAAVQEVYISQLIVQ